MRNAPDPELVALVLDQLRAGVSLRDIEEVAGVSTATISRWGKKHGVRPRTTAPRALVEAAAERAAEPPPPEEPEPPPVDSLEGARAMQRDLQRTAVEARRSGNFTAAQRAMRDAANLLPTIARLEKAGAEDSDVLRISRAELADARASLEAKIRLATARPLLCAHCSRALSIRWAEGSDPEPTAPAKP